MNATLKPKGDKPMKTLVVDRPIREEGTAYYCSGCETYIAVVDKPNMIRFGKHYLHDIVCFVKLRSKQRREHGLSNHRRTKM